MRRPSPQPGKRWAHGIVQRSRCSCRLPFLLLPPAAVVPRVTIENAIKIFIGNREGAKLAQPTLGKYGTVTRRLGAFADTRGYVMLDQFTQADMDLFYAAWNVSARTKGKRLGTLRAFFRFCLNRKWLTDNPLSSDIRPPKGANRVANKAPFTDEELTRIVAACDKLPEVTWSNGHARGVWTGEDVKDWMMVHTGLRISDVGLFNINRLKGHEVFLRAKKNGGEVFAYIPSQCPHRAVRHAAFYRRKLR